MSVAYVSSIIDAPVTAAWSVLGDFHGLADWVDMIAESTIEGGEGVGSIRHLKLVDGRVAKERLISYDAPGRRYSYEFAHEPAPFPVRAYRGTVHLLPVTETNQTLIEWHGEYDCETAQVDDMRTTFTGIYTEFIANLRAHLVR